MHAYARKKIDQVKAAVHQKFEDTHYDELLFWSLVCFGINFLSAFIIFLMFWTSYHNAKVYDKESKKEGNYDLCGDHDVKDKDSTEWKALYFFNTIIYAVLSLIFGLSMARSWLF